MIIFADQYSSLPCIYTHLPSPILSISLPCPAFGLFSFSHFYSSSSQVMTSVYGVTYIGARKQIQEKIEEKVRESIRILIYLTCDVFNP